MAFNNQGGPSSASFRQPSYEYPSEQGRDQPMAQSDFQLDPLEWYPHFQNCRRFFLDHSQHNPGIQAVAAWMNILLPYQRQSNPITSCSTPTPSTTGSSRGAHPSFGRSASSSVGGASECQDQSVSLNPYIRRLVVTGCDTQRVLQTFFGDDWVKGIGQLHQIERRNYLFAAKSGSWLEVKASYEPSPNETIPYMMPLRNPTESEIRAAEEKWSEWLALQDWMVGPRAPPSEAMNAHIKREQMD